MCRRVDFFAYDHAEDTENMNTPQYGITGKHRKMESLVIIVSALKLLHLDAQARIKNALTRATWAQRFRVKLGASLFYGVFGINLVVLLTWYD